MFEACNKHTLSKEEQTQMTKREQDISDIGKYITMTEDQQSELDFIKYGSAEYGDRCRILSHQRYTLLESIYRLVRFDYSYSWQLVQEKNLPNI
jgi:hypothetical protein